MQKRKAIRLNRPLEVSLMRAGWIITVAACGVFVVANRCQADETWQPDEVTLEQAALEREQMATGQPHAFCPAMAAFRRTAQQVEYPAGEDKLPGYLYKPAGTGPFPAVIWNHGSEKEPRAQPELARFYVAQGFVFFAPIRHGHAQAAGDYIVDLQNRLRTTEKSAAEIEKNRFSCTTASTPTWWPPSSG